MIGMKEIDESITFDIGRNIDYLNEEIERRILFEIRRLFNLWTLIMHIFLSFIKQLQEEV